MTVDFCGPCSDTQKVDTTRLTPCAAFSTSLVGCQLCTIRDPVVKFCLDCKRFLGKCCSDVHSKIYCWLGHRVLSLQNDFRCFHASSNSLYLYCNDCKLLFCNEHLLKTHLSLGHNIETLDSVIEDLNEELQKINSEFPDMLRELESIANNLSGRSTEIIYRRTSVGNETADDFIFDKTELRKDKDFCLNFQYYWDAIQMSSQEDVRKELMERFGLFLSGFMDTVIACDRMESKLLFVPLLQQCIQNPETFARSATKHIPQEICEGSQSMERHVEPRSLTHVATNTFLSDKIPCQMFTPLVILLSVYIAMIADQQTQQESNDDSPIVSIHGHPTDEGDADKTPEQELEAFTNDKNNHCDGFKNLH